MKYIIYSLLLFLAQLSAAQDIQTNADQYLSALAGRQRFSGVLLIAKGDTVVFQKAYGPADLASGRMNTISTQFRAGSLTKMFTSALILQLVDQHQLYLDEKILAFLPAASWSNNITVKQLLSHTSGISGTTPANARSLNEMVEGFQAGDFHFEPGTAFEYNNFNYILLSYIAERASGKQYPQLLQELLLSRVGMQRTGIDSMQRKTDDRAFGYTLDPANGEWQPAGEDQDVALASGAGALYTTAGDLLKWSRYVQRSLNQNGSRLSSAVKPVLNNYGLGWMTGEQAGHQFIGHTGSIPGFVSMLMIFPADSTTVIFLSNFQDMNTNQFVSNIAAIAFNQPFEMPVDKKQLQLSADMLREYEGTYGADPASQLKFVLENEKLLVLAPGGDKIPLAAESADQFFIDGPGIIIRFNRKDGRIESVFVSMGNQTLSKIK